MYKNKFKKLNWIIYLLYYICLRDTNVVILMFNIGTYILQNTNKN